MKTIILQIDNFFRSVQIVIAAIGRNMFLFRVGAEIRLVQRFGANANDKSWIGCKSKIVRVAFPFIHIETKDFWITKRPVVIDVREYAIQKW